MEIKTGWSRHLMTESEEPFVTKQTKTWTKPTLTRLGRIANVAGTQPGACQTTNPGGNCTGNGATGVGFS